MITLFESYLIAHIIGDYLLQTENEANQKAQLKFFNWPLVIHVIKYTLCLVVPTIYFQVSPMWLIWIFGTHYLLDRRAFVIWWRKSIMRNSRESIKDTFWLTIVVDQIFHILVIAVICIFG